MKRVQATVQYSNSSHCVVCNKNTVWSSVSLLTCTCLGCGQTAYVEGSISGALEVFCGQCKAKSPWLVYSGGRVCMGCGTKV